MSDTDDTDLLLLIPPDFFLVRSDLEDFESDIDLGYSREIKDTIVSDLITQVNDLESRICHIESIERTSTRCSTCNEDSFINQSIISLTESDVLRAQIKGQRELSKKGSSDNPLMVKSICNDFPSGLISEGQEGIRNFNSTSTAPDTVKGSVEDSTRTNEEICNQNLKNDIPKKSLVAQSQLSREKQTQLLNEVDYFLLSKQLNAELIELPSDNNQTIDQESLEISINNVSVDYQSPRSYKADSELEIKDEHIQSLALTEVYKLITEMEETQTEMQRKLNFNSSKHSSQIQDKNNDSKGTSRQMKSFGQVLELDDLATKSPKQLYGKQAGDVLDQYINEKNHTVESVVSYRLGKNADTSYSSTQLPLSSEDKLNHRTFKSLSPSRVAAGSYNPIDIVRANLPARQDGKASQFSDEKHSPRKSSGFRRQLQFEKPPSPLRSSKSRISLHGEQRPFSLNENKDDKFVAPLLRTNRPSKNSLEDKFKALTIQRSSATNYIENPNVHHNILAKPSSETLQPKISSNNLMSLSELWNKEPSFYSDDPNKLRQKLEEERYRRQHCEQQIQALQLRVLEEQEKLAVAIRVDQEKDRAIAQITESWRRLNEHWGELEEQRHGLAQQLQAEQEASKRKSEELSKKVERWEKEVSQALDLAAGYKEKSEAVHQQMESLKSETEEKLEEAEKRIKNIIEENQKLSEENTNLKGQLKCLQKQLKEEEDLLSKLKVELEKCRKRNDEFEAENSVLKEQKSSLTTGIKEERNRISILEQKLNSLQQDLNEACKKEAAAAEEARAAQARVEVARTELRALYQGQLEAVVKEKLQEFQSQLEVAEAALRAELRDKEKLWADKASDQLRQMHDKYKRDLLRVEQIHKSDVNSWKEKLAESERLRATVEKRLQEEADRRADIAQRLHSVMETQWREALNIISNPVKALYEIPKEDSPKWAEGQSPERLQGHGDVRASRSDSTASAGPGEEAPFCRDGLVTYRTQDQQPTQDHQLKKYIQMLLERGPGIPFPPQTTATVGGQEQQTFPPYSSEMLDKWIMENDKKTEQSERQNQFNKPPWR